jgi:hypothetical protein
VRAPATKAESKRELKSQQSSKLSKASKRIAKNGKGKSKRGSRKDNEFEASGYESEASDEQQQRGRSKSAMNGGTIKMRPEVASHVARGSKRASSKMVKADRTKRVTFE